jgi:hypothetical protein
VALFFFSNKTKEKEEGNRVGPEEPGEMPTGDECVGERDGRGQAPTVGETGVDFDNDF